MLAIVGFHVNISSANDFIPAFVYFELEKSQGSLFLWCLFQISNTLIKQVLTSPARGGGNVQSWC